MAPFLLLAVFMVFGLVSIRAWQRHAQRQKELPRVARSAGLSYSEGDAFDSARVPFRLFRQGDGHEVSNTMWGKAPDGAPVRAFDYSYYVESRDGTLSMGLNPGRDNQVEVQRRYKHFTCALTEVPVVWPHLVITPEKGMARVANLLVGDDIDFESGEFNRMFRITCEDRQFAQTFIDAQMIDFLLTTKGEFQVEVRGRWILLSTGQLPPRGFPGLINLSNAMRAVIPPLVWDLYPHGPRASLDGGMV
jgi:hypothetical protein